MIDSNVETLERLKQSLVEQLISEKQSALEQSRKNIEELKPQSSEPLVGQIVDQIPSDTDLKKRKEEQEIDHQDKRFEAEMEQRRMDRELKKNIATLVFRFLAVETFALFFVVLIQGFKPFDFGLQDSTINIFLGATLLQISSMAVIITRHLYPTDNR